MVRVIIVWTFSCRVQAHIVPFLSCWTLLPKCTLIMIPRGRLSAYYMTALPEGPPVRSWHAGPLMEILGGSLWAPWGTPLEVCGHALAEQIAEWVCIEDGSPWGLYFMLVVIMSSKMIQVIKGKLDKRMRNEFKTGWISAFERIKGGVFLPSMVSLGMF